MNQRQMFAAALRNKTDAELTRVHAKVKRDYEKAKQNGSCALEAVLWLDLKQVEREQEKR